MTDFAPGDKLARAMQAFAQADFPAAITLLEKVAAEDSDNADAFVHHGLRFSFLELGEADNALRAWLRALELDSNYDFTHFGCIQRGPGRMHSPPDPASQLDKALGFP
jgi:tetratricopeptide (TPR) repeat protein